MTPATRYQGRMEALRKPVSNHTFHASSFLIKKKLISQEEIIESPKMSHLKKHLACQSEDWKGDKLIL